MDPLTAFAQMVTALCNLGIEISKGQTPEQKKIIWDWIIADVTRMRKAFNIPD